MTSETSETFFDGEQALVGEIMIALNFGRIDPLVKLLRRRKPISAPLANFIGELLSDGFGEYVFKFEKKGKRGAKKQHEAFIRALRAAIFANWLKAYVRPGQTRPPGRENVINLVADRFHIDPKRLRGFLRQLEKLEAPNRPWRELATHCQDGLSPIVRDAAPLLARIADVVIKYQ